MKKMTWKQFSFVLTSCFLTITVIFASFPVRVSAAGDPSSPFSDVKGHWAESSILGMYEKGVVNGFPDGTFRPNDRVNIDQFIKMMVASMAEKTPNGMFYWREAFTEKLDIYQKSDLLRSDFDLNNIPSSTYWAEPYLQFAHDMFLINRNSEYYEGKFDRPLTREVAAFTVQSTLSLLNYEESTRFALLGLEGITDHTDIDEGLEYSVGSAIVKGILVGYPDGSFRPKGFITRAEAVVIIDRIWNEKLRKPYLPDLSKQFYTIVTLPDGQQRYAVFESEEFVQVVKTLGQAAQLSKGFADFDGRYVQLFDSKDTMEAHLERLESEPFFFEEAPYDFAFGITASENHFVFSAKDYNFDNSDHKEAVSLYLEMMFDNDTDIFMEKFIAFAKRHAAGERPSPEDYVLNGRDVRLMMNSPTAVVAYISVQRDR